MPIKIEIKVGSVVDQEVDAVVCSANNWLFLGTGNAGEIRKAGGEEIQKECDQIIARNNDKPLKIGSAVITGSANLSDKTGYRKYVIHAIGLGYREMRNNKPTGRILATPDSVGSAVTSALELADKLKIYSIAFPLMCARPGYSIYKTADAPRILLQAMLTVIKKFDKKNQNISKIIICLSKKYSIPINLRGR